MYIGKKARIVKSSNPALVGLTGVVQNETKFTFTIKTSKGKKMIKKNEVTICISSDKEEFEVDGSSLIGAPEERVKW